METIKRNVGAKTSPVRVTRADGSVEHLSAYNKFQLKSIDNGGTGEQRRKRKRARVTWRKTQTGEWVVVGPPTVVKVDRSVVVTSRAKLPKRVRVLNVGRQFENNGKPFVYGYVDQKALGLDI